MRAILRKEVSTFFNSPIAYLVIGIFLLLNGLFLWVFNGEFNIFSSGVASLQNFFILAPWVLIFLVPAITMRSISDEKKQGTLELLLSKPISDAQIIAGKLFGALCLVIIAILPTLLYIYALQQLSLTGSTIDYGSIIGSYIGLAFLATTYVAIGIFSSALTENQIVAFIIAVFLCFFMYYGFDGLSDYTPFGNSFNLEELGMSYHFKSMTRGVMDTRDLVYFISISAVFFLLTLTQINKR